MNPHSLIFKDLNGVKPVAMKFILNDDFLMRQKIVRGN